MYDTYKTARNSSEIQRTEVYRTYLTLPGARTIYAGSSPNRALNRLARSSHFPLPFNLAPVKKLPLAQVLHTHV